MYYYRKEIDGLRAIAVVPVVLFHAGFNYFSGGFVGVDVFFVISGYLITSIILRQKTEKSFSIFRFYEKRIRRILPVLFLVILLCIPLAFIFMLPHQLKDFSQSLIATVFFSSNIFFYLKTDYFNDLSEVSPLLHTWSLAIEEQFYLVFPLVLAGIWKFKKKWSVFILLCLGGYSLLLTQYNFYQNPTGNFYLIHTRAWELVIGALCAFYLFRKPKEHKIFTQTINSALGAIGVILILFAVTYFDERIPYPSFYTLLPTIGTALIILFASNNNYLVRFLSNRLLVYMGLLSYSLYLWHQPLFAFARIISKNNVSGLNYVLLIILSLALSIFSYKYCESIFRDRKKVSIKKLFLVLGILFVMFIGFGYSGHKSDGFMSYKYNKLEPEYKNIVINRNKVFGVRQHLWDSVSKYAKEPYKLANKKNTLILGDSKSEDLYVALHLNKHFFEYNEFRQLRLDEDCMQNFDKYDYKNETSVCLKEINNVLGSNLLKESEVVVLSNTWTYFANKNVVAFANYLVSREKKVYVVSTGNFNDLASLSMEIAQREIPSEELNSFLFKNIRQDWKKISDQLKEELKGINNVYFLEKLDLFCNIENETCNLFLDSKALIYDTGHVTKEGAYFMGKEIYKAKWFEN